MTSFISALSLFLLVLSNGCFTLPIVDEPLSSSTFSSLDNDATSGPIFNLRLVSEDETNELPTTEKSYSADEQMEYETSTFFNSLSEENLARLSREFDELFTTEQTDSEKREYDDLSFTTVEAITQGIELQRRGLENVFENETDSGSENDKREIQVELTTNEMFTFTSTSSMMTPIESVSESSTSTEKYTGLLEDETENEKSSTKKPDVPSEENLEENFKDNAAPTAVFDQEALKKIPNVPVEYLVLDENNTLVVTDFPKKFSTSTMKIPQEPKPLDQGEESLHTEEKESHH